jgi:hypothetical protein
MQDGRIRRRPIAAEVGNSFSGIIPGGGGWGGGGDRRAVRHAGSAPRNCDVYAVCVRVGRGERVCGVAGRQGGQLPADDV